MTQTRQVCLAALAAFPLIAPPSAQARQIVLAWDPSPEPNVTGYILFYGPLPGVYTTSVDVGNLISYQIDLPGTQYYFALTAYGAALRVALRTRSARAGDLQGSSRSRHPR